MEIWDLYNLNGEIIGEHTRGTMMPENGYHLVVHVWIRNSEGKYLMTKRSANKKMRKVFFYNCELLNYKNDRFGALKGDLKW